VDPQSPIALDMVVEVRLEQFFRSPGIEILIDYTESSVLYQLSVAATQMSVKLEMSLKGKKACHEEAVVASVEVAWVGLLPWRRFLGRRVNTSYANGWHMLKNLSYGAGLLC
jgi:hypothetical protein